MKSTEIGSEFQYIKSDNANGIILPKVKDYTFTFSGRTAIETVLNNEPSIKKALLPSYCCDSMIEPFRQKRIEISFYSVNYQEKLVINFEDIEVDAILWCNYFGFKYKMPDFSEFINKGGIIIEDITHSFYSLEQFNEQSHYLIASLRKWEPLISGGYCGCRNGILNTKPIIYPSNKFVFNKKLAMKEKSDYLNGFEVEKEDYLKKFNNSNKWLSLNYSNLKIDNYSLRYLKCVNVEKQIMIRRNNAKVLYYGLKNNENICFLFEEEAMDCPLFVPIIIKNGRRNELRKKLIENEIYCPIHWPKPNNNCESNLYYLELSLVCDQRYDEKDMQRIVSIINDF